MGDQDHKKWESGSHGEYSCLFSYRIHWNTSFSHDLHTISTHDSDWNGVFVISSMNVVNELIQYLKHMSSPPFVEINRLVIINIYNYTIIKLHLYFCM